MQLVNRRNLIIAGAVAVLLVIVGLLFAAQQAKKPASNNTPSFFTDTGKYDANSGDTTSNIVGKTPDNFGLLPDTPVYLGLTGFLDTGLSMTQLNDVKYAFYKYATSTSPKIKQVSFTKNSFLTVPPDASGKATMTFDVVLDSQPRMHGSLVYSDTESIELTLFDATNNKIFESGTITNKSVESL
jgi:hypothetical protein